MGSLAAGRRFGFPRTGGDGPVLASRGMSGAMLPPHGRGWTGGGPGTRDQAAASPARAGMDPATFSPSVRPRCFPRTGGDGPEMMSSHRLLVKLPPHGRGWTCVSSWIRALSCASPARAGMDRLGVKFATGYERFPRTGGDGYQAALR